jgi:RNA polymerase sigma-70 factor (ECF subfamily)
MSNGSAGYSRPCRTVSPSRFDFPYLALADVKLPVVFLNERFGVHDEANASTARLGKMRSTLAAIASAKVLRRPFWLVAGEFTESLRISRYTAAVQIDYNIERNRGFFDECPNMTDWETVVNQHAGMVWRTVRRLVSNPADAWDCVQDTFLEAVKIDRRELVHDWSGLLRHLATVRALDFLRARSRQRHRCSPDEDTSLAISREADPPCQAQASELADRLRAAVSQLPRRQAQVFCLTCFERMTSEQVGERLGISASAARMLLCRARDRLRQILVSDVAHGDDD